ncbi:DUF3043 domain-containing protein [Demequina lignilytica]|uniref:DUF3043 domain-containing protein n=1 Tax=Demequina lignilytica TaxID=3051663 RepID=A0AAW7M7X7_9MICO|nr:MULTISPECIES: DUF3043 domain-containing protein [unclassified Demequina]MDN4482173.1 DUF3043 domain-containing protein [Demequina sp. SYSU T0a273]MDN4486832.1 DUF3043 domain-containing protein [Demequina sp. SYSU T00039]MDN4489516.1 DUF3043 domain-containing protein [Demequina sp. SYSU T00068]
MSDQNTNETPATEIPGIEVPGDRKGRPTPKRKDQEAARRRPIVPDGKQAKKEQREKMRAQREKEYQAMREGDERHMPLEHRGPERRFLRDYVDARTTLGEFLLPVSIVFVVASLLVPSQTWAGLGLIVFFYLLVIIVAVDTFLMTRRLKKRFVEKFGWKKLPRGWTFYVIARQLNIRRFRAPKPAVNRGEFPS